MQDGVVGMEAFADVEGSRESEGMCFLARLFDEFADSTRLAILLHTVHQELRVGRLDRIAEAVAGQGAA